MEIYISKHIKRHNLLVETNIYYDGKIRHNVVKLTYKPAKIENTVDSVIGELSAYNAALKGLETKIFDKVNKIIGGKHENQQ